MAVRFTLPAIKLTEHRLQVSVTKDGVTEADIQCGIRDETLFVDMDKREVRRIHNNEVVAKLGDVELPIPVWKVLVGTLKE
jgi:hypothetical protein